MIGLSIAYVLAREGVARDGPRPRRARPRGVVGRRGHDPAAHRAARTTTRSIELRSWSAVLYPEWSAALLEETGIDNGYRRTGGVDVACDRGRGGPTCGPPPAAGGSRGSPTSGSAPATSRRVEPALNPALRGRLLPARPRPDPQPAAPPGPRGRAAAPGRDAPPRTGRSSGSRRDGGRVVGGPDRRRAICPAARWSSRPGPGRAGCSSGLGVRVADAAAQGADRPAPGRPARCSAGSSSTARTTSSPATTAGSWSGRPRRTPASTPGPTPEAVRDLLDEALALCPVLAEAEVERTWAGLRPGSIDTRPYLGRLPGFDNLIVATGHKRAGLQLAPATAEVVADLVLGRPPRIDLAPFRAGPRAAAPRRTTAVPVVTARPVSRPHGPRRRAPCPPPRGPRATARSPSRRTRAPGLGAVLDELALGAEVEAAFGQVAEEGRVLVDDPDDPEPLAAAELGQRRPLGLGQRAVGAGGSGRRGGRRRDSRGRRRSGRSAGRRRRAPCARPPRGPRPRASRASGPGTARAAGGGGGPSAPAAGPAAVSRAPS